MNGAACLALTAIALTASVPHAWAAMSWDERVEFGAGLYEIRGHIWAIERNIDGQKQSFEHGLENVRHHAFHPIGEVYPGIGEAVSEADADLDDRLRLALETLNALGQNPDSTGEILEAAAAAKAAVDDVQERILGPDSSSDPALAAAIASSLITLTADEYEAAITDGRVEFAIELQDAYAFHMITHTDIFANTRSSYDPAQAAEIDGLFSEFYGVFDAREDPSKVTAMAARLASILDSSFDSPVQEAMADEVRTLSDEEKRRALEYVANVRGLLLEAKASYASDPDAALELVKEAYIDNYEYIEDDIEEVGQEELGTRVEHMIREELTGAIRAGSADVPQMIDDVLVELDMVEQVVPEFGALAAVVLVAGVASTIALLSRQRSLMPAV